MRGLRTGDRGRGPGLRHARLRRGYAGVGRHAARPAPGLTGGRPERAGAAQRDRRPHDPASLLPPESAPAQAGRRGVRLDQDGRRRRQAALSRPGPEQALVPTDRRRLQPHPPGQHRGGRHIAQPGGDLLKRRSRAQGRTPRPTEQTLHPAQYPIGPRINTAPPQ